jgi:GntP family gluconate:H+ symporter
LNADLGLTLLFGLIIAVPTVIISGPVFGNFISRYVVATAPEALIPSREPVAVGADSTDLRNESGRIENPDGGINFVADDPGTAGSPAAPARPRRKPAFWPAVLTILLPVVLMLLRAIGELTLDEGSGLRSTLDVIGAPLVALLAGLVLAMFTLGFAAGFNRDEVSSTIGGALPAIAGILLIVAAGGGFKQVLIDAGVGQMIADAANGANLSPLVLGWLIAVGIRVATGSATVATITAAGIVTPLAADLSSPTVALLVLAIGSGSLFFSHVNDAGFWLVKEYLGLTVGQTIKTWSVMETIISVCGLAGVLVLSIFV